MKSYSDEKGTISGRGAEIISTGLNILKRAVRANNFEKGWRSETAPKRSVSEFVSLLTTEVAEVYEAYRNGEPLLWYQYPNGVTSNQSSLLESLCYFGDVDSDNWVLGKPQGMASELADIIIRVMDMADELDIPVVQAVLKKHAYNQTRSYRHGNKLA